MSKREIWVRNEKGQCLPRDPVCGVYLLTADTGHYIGGSVDCIRRWVQHRSQLRKGIHQYQAVFKKAFKAGTLSLFILQRCPIGTPEAELLKLEQEWANKFPFRINALKSVTGKGKVITTKQRVKISATKTGVKLKPAHSKKLRRAISFWWWKRKIAFWVPEFDK